MKKLLIFFLLSPFLVKGQDSLSVKLPFDDSGNIVYTEVGTSKLPKEQLFKNAQTWIAKNYGDYKSVIQLDDLTTGNIIFKGLTVTSNIGGDLVMKTSYTVQLDIKPSKYRIKVTDIKQHTHMGFMPVERRDEVLPFEEYYKKQLARKDAQADKRWEILKEQDDVIKNIIKAIKEALEKSDDF